MTAQLTSVAAEREAHRTQGIVRRQAMYAMSQGMFTEWLECFVRVWNATHDAVRAANAGIIEWDL